MKKLSRYAFLIRHSSYSKNDQHAVLKSKEFTSMIVGVKNIKEAISIIIKLSKEGIELIELCGGFSLSEERAIRKATKNLIPIGRVKLKSSDEVLLKKNLAM